MNKQHIAIITCSIARFTKNKFKFNVTHSICQLAIFTNFQFHKVQVPTTSPTLVYSSTSCGCISGILGTMCSCNIYFEPKNWNSCTMKLLYPPPTTHLLDATCCLAFFGFINATNCPITNYIHPTRKSEFILIVISMHRIAFVYLYIQSNSLCKPLSS